MRVPNQLTKRKKMISASVFEREKQNNGSVAHCYFDPEIGTWLAYGRSAYALRRMVKTAGYDNLRSYSYDFDIACAMVGNLTFNQICECSTTLEQNEEYVCIESSLDFDAEAYDKWVEKGYCRVCQGNKVRYNDVTAWYRELMDVHDIYLLYIGYDAYSATYWVDEMVKACV